MTYDKVVKGKKAILGFNDIVRRLTLKSNAYDII